ncbi:MAG: fibronectin type III domain-containing protein, partial [Bdellovibrionia bacterium]
MIYFRDNKCLFPKLVLVVFPTLIGCGVISDLSKKLSSTIGTPPTVAIDLTGGTIFTNQSTYTLQVTSDQATASFSVEVYGQADCQGTELQTASQTTGSVILTGLADGNVYSVRVRAQNSDGVSEPICSSAVVVDTQSPNNVSFLSPLSDSNSGANQYAFDWSTSDVGLAGLKNHDGYKVETFTSAACAGLSVSSAIQEADDFVYSGLATGNIYSLRVTAYDKAG